jgi:2-hydroxychromene-2-carboxylate isomerase
VYHIEPIKRKFHRVGLMKLERISRLRIDINADHVKARAMVAHRTAAGTAEQIKQPRLRARLQRSFEFGDEHYWSFL